MNKKTFSNENSIIKDDLIGIRPVEISDADEFYEAARESTDHVCPFQPWCHQNYSKQENDQWIISRAELWKTGTQFSFIIYNLKTGKLLGGVGLHRISFFNKIAETGCWIRKGQIKKGIAVRALKLLAQFSFAVLGLHRLEGLTDYDNIAAITAAKRAGFYQEAVLRERHWKNNVPKDVCLLVLLDEEKSIV